MKRQVGKFTIKHISDNIFTITNGKNRYTDEFNAFDTIDLLNSDEESTIARILKLNRLRYNRIVKCINKIIEE